MKIQHSWQNTAPDTSGQEEDPPFRRRKWAHFRNISTVFTNTYIFLLQQLLIHSLLYIICLKSEDSALQFLLTTRKCIEENDDYYHNTMKPNKNACI